MNPAFFISGDSDAPSCTIPAFFTHKGQKMDARFVQAHKEARWALWLTLCYLGIAMPHHVQFPLSSPIRDKKWTLVLFRPIKRRAGRCG
ncbi:hypothetical protein FK157_02480 [Salmonella enterica]|nr:hypothetical protein [Salmonella enterica]